MTIAQNGAPTSHKPLRLWPGVALLILQWLLRFGLPAINPDAILVGMLGELVCGLGILIWWAFFSRVPRSERWGALLLIVVALAATWRLLDVSIATGMMGMMFPMFAIPVVCLALVLAAVAAQYLSGPLRRPAMAAVVLIACFMFALLRTNGIMGSVVLTDFAWRWSKTHEERLLARTDESAALPATPVSLPSAPATLPAEPAKLPSPPPEPAALPALAETGAGWPGFRGPHRDSVIPGTRIATDWSQTPPTQLWRRPIGPGWSSFAVLGGYLYTQEQRGSDEIVACYRVTNGKPVWTHRDPARFWESNAGAGPRATPTLANGRLYTFGATGILNALDARNGAVIWSRNAAADTHIKVPGWGFASSPWSSMTKSSLPSTESSPPTPSPPVSRAGPRPTKAMAIVPPIWPPSAEPRRSC
jgi:outer membrane protein assembly factor BamB